VEVLLRVEEDVLYREEEFRSDRRVCDADGDEPVTNIPKDTIFMWYQGVKMIGGDLTI
jgi:hypothetical protein